MKNLILISSLVLTGCIEAKLDKKESLPNVKSEEEQQQQGEPQPQQQPQQPQPQPVDPDPVDPDPVDPDPVDPDPVDPDPVDPDPVDPDPNQQEPETPAGIPSGPTSRSTIAPVLSAVSDVILNHKSGENLSVQMVVENEQSLNGILHWTKDYGPDGVSVHPQSGLVTWDIPNSLPSESFHVGLKASSLNESISISFIVHAGVSEVLTVGAGGDYSTLKAGMNALSSGGTLVVLDGVYEGDNNYVGLTGGGSVNHPPSGTTDAFTTLMAKNPSRAVLKNGAYIRLNGNWPVSYVAFKGFFIQGGQAGAFGYGKNKAESNLRHHHLKFIRNGVEGGETRSPFNAFRSDDILFENNYAFGGGRYKFASYQAENIVMRRNVARYDRGTVNGEPKGTYSVYTTMNGFISNNLAIDGDSPDFVNQGELAGEFTTPTTSGNTRAKFHRNMQLNSAFLFGNMDDQAGDSDVEHRDIVSWDVRPESRYVMTWGSAWFDHMTMGEINPRKFVDQYFNGYHNNTRGITNSILHNLNNGDLFYSLRKEADHETVGRTVERFGVDTVNITDVEGALITYQSDLENITDISPLYADGNAQGGLRYLTRIEEDSNLSGRAMDGGDLGATVMTHLGRSGTFHGEAGYDVETDIPMWPFPMEDIIREKMAEYSYTGSTYTGHYTNRSVSGTGTITGERGFAEAGQSLTNYVWEYLGHIAPPFNITVSVESDSALIQWSQHQDVTKQDVTGYKIYFVNGSNGTQTLIDSVSKNELSYQIENLNSNTEYSVVVTTVTATEESSFSYITQFETL